MGFLFGKSNSVKRADFWKVFSILCQDNSSLAEIWNNAIFWADKKLKNNSKKICNDLESSCILSEIVLKYPKVFCLLEIQMIKAGEILNNLDEQLKELSEVLYKVGFPSGAGYGTINKKEKELAEENNIPIHNSIPESAQYNSNIKPVMKLFFYVLQRALSEHVEEIRIIPEVDIMKVSYKTVKSIYVPEHFANLPKKLYEIMVVEIKKIISTTEIDEALEENERYLHLNLNSQKHSFIISFFPSQNGEIIVIKIKEEEEKGKVS